MKALIRTGLMIFGLFSILIVNAFAQIEPAPDRAEGEGPFERLVLRGGILIDGTGAPPVGPVDIVVENAYAAVFVDVAVADDHVAVVFH